MGHGSLRDGLFVEFTHNMRLYSINKETRLIAKSKFVPISPINSIIVPVEVFMRCLTEFSERNYTLRNSLTIHVDLDKNEPENIPEWISTLCGLVLKPPQPHTHTTPTPPRHWMMMEAVGSWGFKNSLYFLYHITSAIL